MVHLPSCMHLSRRVCPPDWIRQLRHADWSPLYRRYRRGNVSISPAKTSMLDTNVNLSLTSIARRFAMVAPLYISEISPPEIRGTLLVLQELSIVTGIVIAFYITYGTRHIPGEWSWRLPFLIQMLPAIGLGIGVPFLPYTPRWLCQKGRDEQALKTLSKLRQVLEEDPRVQQEWYEIRSEVAYRAEIEAEKYPNLQDGTVKSRLLIQANNWADCWRGTAWRRTQVGVGLMFFQQVRITPPSSATQPVEDMLTRDAVCRYQRFDLLQSHPLRYHGPRLRNAADNVRRAQHMPGGGLSLELVGNGQVWPTQAASLGRSLHVCLSLHHCSTCRSLQWQMARARGRSLDFGRFPALLHAEFRRHMVSLFFLRATYIFHNADQRLGDQSHGPCPQKSSHPPSEQRAAPKQPCPTGATTSSSYVVNDASDKRSVPPRLTLPTRA